MAELAKCEAQEAGTSGKPAIGSLSQSFRFQPQMAVAEGQWQRCLVQVMGYDTLQRGCWYTIEFRSCTYQWADMCSVLAQVAATRRSLQCWLGVGQ
eukprot:8591089-Alexandrium_andersonii.AAC.1